MSEGDSSEPEPPTALFIRPWASHETWLRLTVLIWKWGGANTWQLLDKTGGTGKPQCICKYLTACQSLLLREKQKDEGPVVDTSTEQYKGVPQVLNIWRENREKNTPLSRGRSWEWLEVSHREDVTWTKTRRRRESPFSRQKQERMIWKKCPELPRGQGSEQAKQKQVQGNELQVCLTGRQKPECNKRWDKLT